ncbi:alkylated DNA repair protein ALKBH8 homolog isoform X2 [Vicia villosa]|uniref:alkylated DNA repair protein ALKBH8 homolog isoform X2 n=1 Tax=Vicia villosa TaxID=3911 RepID=UPI00273B55A8|nr:alkylated DNA repair protein ALKBH8 homolog isoform X2 [Vicia villosa]
MRYLDELILNDNICVTAAAIGIQNVNTRRCLSELPSFLSPIFERISSCPTFKNVDSDSIVLEQLKVVFPRKEMVCPRAGS